MIQYIIIKPWSEGAVSLNGYVHNILNYGIKNHNYIIFFSTHFSLRTAKSKIDRLVSYREYLIYQCSVCILKLRTDNLNLHLYIKFTNTFIHQSL